MFERLTSRSNRKAAKDKQQPGDAPRTVIEGYGQYVQDNYIWHADPQVQALYDAFDGPRPPSIKDRHFNLYNLAKLTRHIEGDTVECGVFEGLGSFLILKAVDNPAKRHHGFDSFEGLSEPMDVDKAGDATYQWKKGDLTAGLQGVQQRLSAFPNCTLYRGWIPDRFPDMAAQRISFVHVDVDLYQPTLDSLAFFYERVSPGGIILLDDYGSTSCPGQKKAVDEFFADRPEEVICITTCQAFVMKR